MDLSLSYIWSFFTWTTAGVIALGTVLIIIIFTTIQSIISAKITEWILTPVIQKLRDVTRPFSSTFNKMFSKRKLHSRVEMATDLDADVEEDIRKRILQLPFNIRKKAINKIRAARDDFTETCETHNEECRAFLASKVASKEEKNTEFEFRLRRILRDVFDDFVRDTVDILDKAVLEKPVNKGKKKKAGKSGLPTVVG